jgi:hypothetical protein
MSGPTDLFQWFESTQKKRYNHGFSKQAENAGLAQLVERYLAKV